MKTEKQKRAEYTKLIHEGENITIAPPGTINGEEGGITDVYTKAEIDTMIGGIDDQLDEIDSKITEDFNVIYIDNSTKESEVYAKINPDKINLLFHIQQYYVLMCNNTANTSLYTFTCISRMVSGRTGYFDEYKSVILIQSNIRNVDNTVTLSYNEIKIYSNNVLYTTNNFLVTDGNVLNKFDSNGNFISNQNITFNSISYNFITGVLRDEIIKPVIYHVDANNNIDFILYLKSKPSILKTSSGSLTAGDKFIFQGFNNNVCYEATIEMLTNNTYTFTFTTV